MLSFADLFCRSFAAFACCEKTGSSHKIAKAGIVYLYMQSSREVDLWLCSMFFASTEVPNDFLYTGSAFLSRAVVNRPLMGVVMPYRNLSSYAYV